LQLEASSGNFAKTCIFFLSKFFVIELKAIRFAEMQ